MLDDGSLSEQLFSVFPNGVNKVLELVGTVTLKHSLKLLSHHGVVLCMTGILGGEWVLENFEPMMDIPAGTYFTQFDSGVNFKEKLLVELFNHFEQHKIKVPIAKVFSLDEIHKAHQLIESNAANGKIVVVN
ncbi:zinc-binding dehydrogenase [Neobacillus sp. PS3-12]|uniref:zinc-binding dehydrogenase n=1 Tax=Neobacillus sp. PS3-12 TaxID=3070677 RepID=UPI0027DF92A7|nr:zinc-binding dehydrogenase [Neobacillus sp. PS3-12]WML53386.1 zinc-binding dehydrogenase [Neobacillus sp. PS3-12]